MADVTQAISDLLKADAAVLAIASDRVARGHGLMDFPNTSNIIIEEAPGGGVNHHQTAAHDLAWANVEVHCYATSRGAANALGEAVREALDGRPDGVMGDDSLSVRSVQMTDRFALDIPPGDGSEMGEFRDFLEFLVRYRQGVPTF